MRDYSDPNTEDKEQRLQLVEELKLASRSSVQNVRQAATTAVAIEVRPADSVQRHTLVATGKTKEIQSLSVTAELDMPVAIGSFYEIRFDAPRFDIDAVFVRCHQVALVAEGRFEARFQFLTPVTLSRIASGSPSATDHTR